jgi:hypothetical protein
MSSVFSFLRDEEPEDKKPETLPPAEEAIEGQAEEAAAEEPVEEAAEEPVEEAGEALAVEAVSGVPLEETAEARFDEAAFAAPEGEVAAALAIEGTTPPIDLQPYVNEMLALLSPYLPANFPGMPPNSLSLTELRHRSLGLGGRRGIFTLGGMDAGELRGGWLEGVVRFDLWANDLGALNNQVAVLQSQLLADSPALRQSRLLQLRHAGTAEHLSDDLATLRKSLDYSVLYEYHYMDTDGAAGLIARVPIHSDVDAIPGSEETTEVTDWMVLWSEHEAPVLEVSLAHHDQVTLRRLLIAAYLPGADPPGTVTQEVRLNGGTVSTDFDSLSTFLNNFQLQTEPLTLVYPPFPLEPGETQELHPYQVGELRFATPITLKGGSDLFRIRFSTRSFPPGDLSQIYLRALA